jgi:PAS domain S-box-containing protein
MCDKPPSQRGAETFYEGIWIIDRDSITTFVSPRMAAMLGYVVEEMLGKHLFLFIDENELDICKQHLERCQQGIKAQYDLEFLHKDGTHVYTTFDANPLKDNAGNYAGVVAGVTECGQSLLKIVDQYRALTSTMIDGFCIADLDTHILDVNDAYCRMVDYSRDELLTMSLSDVASLEDTTAHIQQLVESGSARFVSRHRRKDGRIIDVEVSATFLPQQRQVMGFIHDITERRQAEEIVRHSEDALRESEERYRLLVESAPVGIFRTVSHGERQAMSVNSTLAHILGYASSEDAVQSITNLSTQLYVRPERRQEFLQALQAQGHVENFDYEAYNADGGLIWLSMNARIVHTDEKGTFVIEGFTTDITERKRAEKLLQEKVDELERFNRLMVGRELRMIELKQEINQLCDQLGTSPRYDLEFVTASVLESNKT